MRVVKLKYFRLNRAVSGIILAGIWAAITLNSPAQAVFTEDFDADRPANWDDNASSSKTFSNVFFGYSAVVVPSDPHEIGGSTGGLKLAANTSGETLGGFSVSPAELSLFRLKHYEASHIRSSDAEVRNRPSGPVNNVTVSVVPESPSLALILAGGIGLYFLFCRRK